MTQEFAEHLSYDKALKQLHALGLERIGARTLRKWVSENKGGIRNATFALGRHRYFHRDKLIAWVNEQIAEGSK